MKQTKRVMDQDKIERTVSRMAHEIIEKNDNLDKVCLVGIKRRGIPLAGMLAYKIEQFSGKEVPVGHVDITLYRDDLTEISDMPQTSDSEIPVSLSGYTVILVDDVIFTGRTIRAAIDAVFSHGRPERIQLAVLVDRGHRELPIRPDYVGKNLPTSLEQKINVNIFEIDGETNVEIEDR